MPFRKRKGWLADSCEKGAAGESKQTFIICLLIYSPGGCNTRPLAANALVTLYCSDKLAKQTLFCIRKQRLSAEQIRASLLLLLIIISSHRGFNLLFCWKLKVPHSAYITAVTTKVTPGQDTSLCSIIATGPRSGHPRRASAVVDELVSGGGARPPPRPCRGGGKGKRCPESPRQRRCSSSLLWSSQMRSKVTFYSCSSLK